MKLPIHGLLQLKNSEEMSVGYLKYFEVFREEVAIAGVSAG
jgi:hypothetical protein